MTKSVRLCTRANRCASAGSGRWYVAPVKWFTRDWAGGRLSDKQFEDVQQDYAAHVESLRARAPELADILDLDVHDGQVREWGERPGGQFWWRLLVGDLQRGYEHATITYRQATVVGGLDALVDLRLGAPDAEALYDEVEAHRDGGHVHRVLFWPEGELWVRFTSIEVSRTPATPADRSGTPSPVTPDPEDRPC